MTGPYPSGRSGERSPVRTRAPRPALALLLPGVPVSEIHPCQLDPRPYVGVRRTLPTTELGDFFADALPRVMDWLHQAGIEPASPPLAVWLAMDLHTGVADCHAGCFVAAPVAGSGDITPGLTPGGTVLTVMHRGPYDTVGRSWMAAYQEAARLGRQPGPGWEIYVDDPSRTPPEHLRTHIHLPLL